MSTSRATESELSSDRFSPNHGGPCLARVCIVGGGQIMRSGIAALLEQRRCAADSEYQYGDEEAFEKSLGELAYSELPYDLIVLVLAGGPFAVIHRISEILGASHHELPIVVLSEKVNRGEVYAALRIGAKAYLQLDAEPDELAQAVVSAANDKVYLPPDVTELLVNDVSSAYETRRSQRPLSTELSVREIEIVQLLCEGLSSKGIAKKLHLSPKTIENHRYNVYRKCSVDNVAGLMRYAIQNGIVML